VVVGASVVVVVRGRVVVVVRGRVVVVVRGTVVVVAGADVVVVGAVVVVVLGAVVVVVVGGSTWAEAEPAPRTKAPAPATSTDAPTNPRRAARRWGVDVLTNGGLSVGGVTGRQAARWAATLPPSGSAAPAPQCWWAGQE
jgi:hypothetical protein